MSLNQLLTPLGYGSSYVKGYDHASQIFRVDSFLLHPKYQFLFYVRFQFNDSISNFQTDDRKVLGSLAKSVNLPKFSIENKTLNAYNRVNLVQTKLKYDPVTIKFHDDGADIVRAMWIDYYSYYFADGDKTASTLSATHKYSPRTTDDWGYSLRRDMGQPTPQLIKSISIFSFQQKKFHECILHNPMITRFDQGEHDYAQGTGLIDCSMTLNFETVTYQRGWVNDYGFGDDMLRYYDQTPSAISPRTPQIEYAPLPPVTETVIVSGGDLGSQEFTVNNYEGDAGEISAGQYISGKGLPDGTQVDDTYDPNDPEVVPTTEPFEEDGDGVYTFSDSPPGEPADDNIENYGNEQYRTSGTVPATDVAVENGQPVRVTSDVTTYSGGQEVKQSQQSSASNYPSGNYSYGPGAAPYGGVVRASGPQVPTTNNSPWAKVATGLGTSLARQVLAGRNPLGKLNAPAVTNILYDAGNYAGGSIGAQLRAVGGLVKAGTALSRGGFGPGKIGIAVVAVQAGAKLFGKNPQDILPPFFGGRSPRVTTNGSAVGQPSYQTRTPNYSGQSFPSAYGTPPYTPPANNYNFSNGPATINNASTDGDQGFME